MSVHPCAWPRCPELLEVGGPSYCATHGGTVTRAAQVRADATRGSSNARGYTWQWGKRAERFKARYPLCGMRPGGVPPVMSQCYLEGRTTAAYQVDHVVPHRGDQGLFWDEAGNWQSLCASCGSAKSRAGL